MFALQILENIATFLKPIKNIIALHQEFSTSLSMWPPISRNPKEVYVHTCFLVQLLLKTFIFSLNSNM